MKKTYVVFVNKTGNPHGSGTQVTVQAESEHDAMRIALQRVGGKNMVVASIKERK